MTRLAGRTSSGLTARMTQLSLTTGLPHSWHPHLYQENNSSKETLSQHLGEAKAGVDNFDCIRYNTYFFHNATGIRAKLRNIIKSHKICTLSNYSVDPATEIWEKKYYFFFAPIRKAPEYVLNLRRRLIRTIFKHAGNPPKLGLL